ncbi:MAG: SMP-30/gluconolactonase/LRE family protein [Myxococcota bacterium]
MLRPYIACLVLALSACGDDSALGGDMAAPLLDASEDPAQEDSARGDSAPDASSEAAVDASAPPDNAAGRAEGLRATICAAGSFDPEASLDERGPLETVAQEGLVDGTAHAFTFLEGPVWLAERGVLRFSDFNQESELNADDQGPPTIIWELDVDGGVASFLPAGRVRTNGMAVDESGAMIVTAHDAREIARLDPATGTRETLSGAFEGNVFNAPNDLVVAADGTLFFTDPAYNGQVDGRDRALDFEGVFRRAPNGTLSLVDERIGRPNGITLSLDERWLYVASRADDNLYRYPLDASLNVGEREVFLPGESNDGVALDCAGRLYLARPGRGLAIFEADGAFLFQISARQITNAAFGGPDHRTLYITERTRLRAMRMPLPGLPY